MNKLSAVFKALSEPLRLRIVRLLMGNGHEACGRELASALGIPAYQLSRHLKVLKTTGLIHERRAGRWVYYSLAGRNGQLVGALRRILADLPAGSRTATAQAVPRLDRRRARQGRPGRSEERPDGRSRQALIESETFNWNEGPAIPGIL